MVDCLLAHPNSVDGVYLDRNQLTDETGIKLARYLAASSTIESLSLSNNQLGPATYLALAAALRVNSSLRVLYLYNNQAVDRTRIDGVRGGAAAQSRPSSWFVVAAVLIFDRFKAASGFGPRPLSWAIRHCSCCWPKISWPAHSFEALIQLIDRCVERNDSA